MEHQVQSDNPGHSGTPQDPAKKGKSEAFEWLKAIVIAVVLVVVIRWLLFAPFIVDGPSMQPNFHTGERIIVNKIIYDMREPKHGEVVVFHVPSEGRDFIKRVIGVPGDTVKVEGDTVTINGQVINEPYIQDVLDEKHKNNELYNTEANLPNEFVPDGKVPEGYVFVLGDNRSNSTDSRRIGFVPYGDIIGRADLVFWPMKDINFIKH
ncbi:signal peptidase I [Fontibacillus solani]|uniref:Signal peptidase I n=2 Tax=Fontibacillus TaxID=995014 RepID=A0A1G7F3L1_9BACL|nr:MULTISPECIES: signal peptidase I [Fontibacillus]MBA9088691.1 signal peptidase I [Fontibacillus solani]SDE70504.1 type I signal peptidase. Serine peptidase. MEROPS family S26A [Fontibacillus panacisegetis]